MTYQILAVLLLVSTLSAERAFSQTPVAGAPASLAASLQRQQTAIQLNLVESAETMAEADYQFRATLDVRSFGQFIGHVANSQFQICSMAKSEANPNSEDFEKVPAKSALVAALKKSGDYCSAIYAGAGDALMMEQVKNGPGTATRASILMFNIGHSNEHYGNLVTYMRLKGVVPPSTARAQAPKPAAPLRQKIVDGR
jgi:uncharacterized damage-inducible protein DinB